MVFFYTMFHPLPDSYRYWHLTLFITKPDISISKIKADILHWSDYYGKWAYQISEMLTRWQPGFNWTVHHEYASHYSDSRAFSGFIWGLVLFTFSEKRPFACTKRMSSDTEVITFNFHYWPGTIEIHVNFN